MTYKQNKNARLNICMVSWQYFPLPEGGSEKQCRKLVAKLAQQGKNCTILTAFLDKNCKQMEEIEDGSKIVRLGSLAWVERMFHRLYDTINKKPLLRGLERDAFKFWASLPFTIIARFSFMRSLRKYLHENRGEIDILHVHEGHWIAGAVAWASKGLDIPVVCKEATDPFVPRLGYDTPLRSTLESLRKSLYFIALTDSVKESLVLNGIKNEKITLIPNGVEIPHRRAKIIGSKSILYIGNFTQGCKRKAFDVLFQSWIKIHDKRPELSLTILGTGDFSYWQSFLKKNRCLDSVKLMGFVRDVGEYLENARMLILPSRLEGLSNAVLEAMSWGVPVAISDIPTHRGLVRHKKNGIVFPVNNIDALTEAVLELTDNDKLALEIADEGRKTIIEKYSIEKIAESIFSLYLDLLSRRGSL